MDPKRFADAARNAGGRGAGIGMALLAAAGGLAYGISQSLYTGKFSLLK